jgi:hypothetical protein
MKSLTTCRRFLNAIVGALVICLYSCSVSDDMEELSGDYFYTDEGGNAKFIICHLPNRKGIYSTVIEYDYNKDFIIALELQQ